MIENKNLNLSESREVDVVDQARNVWVLHGKKILIALGVLLALVVGIVGYRSFIAGPNEEKATEAMFRAQEYFSQDSVRLALNGDNLNPGFLKIIDKYGSTKAGELARLYAGTCYLKLGDFNNAVKQLKDFSTDSKQVNARALCLLGDALSEQGKTEEAADQYKKAGKVFEEDDFNSPEYYFRAGFLYESIGKKNEAIEMYSLIKTKYPRSERGFDIDKYLSRLGKMDVE
jgi:tetratricopeptide (TPR) repeat protein